jgi:thiamine biosynthesis lipoprotein
MRNIFTIGLALLLAGWGQANAAPVADAPGSPKRFTFTEPHMGTRFKIVLYAPDEAAANAGAKAAFQRIANLDATMSDYRASSELMQLCQKAGGDPAPVSEDLFRVLEKAQEYAKLSDGAFDVTVSPLVRLWRIARRTQQLPNAEELAKAKALVGYQQMKLDPKARTVQLLKAGMLLDLGGIAKGYAADAALAVLQKQGITRALVAAGGDVAVSGPPPDAVGWKIGIQPLEGGEKEPSRFLLLKDAAVSTSGDSEQFVVIDGKRYSHIVDPKTGLGLQGRMSVTVIAPNGLTADPLAKIPSVLGAERGLALVEKIEGTAALFVKKTDKGDEVVESKRFKSFLVGCD